VLPRPLLMLARGEVEEGAPAATPDSIVFLYHPLKVGPCLLSEFLDLKSRCGLSWAFSVRPFISVRVQSCGRWSSLRAEFLGSASSCKGGVRVRVHMLLGSAPGHGRNVK